MTPSKPDRRAKPPGSPRTSPLTAAPLPIGILPLAILTAAITLALPHLAAHAQAPRAQTTDAQQRPQPAPTLAQLAAERRNLSLPDDFRENLFTRHDISPSHLSIPRSQLIHYGRDALVLDTTLALFNRPEHLPRETGRVATDLATAAAAGDIASAIRTLALRLDISAARGVQPPQSPPNTQPIDDDQPRPWGIPWLDRTPASNNPLTPQDALPLILERIQTPTDQAERAIQYLNQLPTAVQRLTARLLIADLRARPWANAAYDARTIRSAIDAHLRASGASPLAIPTIDDAHDCASATFQPTIGIPDQPAAPLNHALDLNHATNLPTLTYAAILHATLTQHAIEEFRAWRFATNWNPDSLPTTTDRGVRFDTALGPVRINGPRDDLTDIGRPADLSDIAEQGGAREPAGLALLIDLGGDDTHTGRVATTGLRGVTAGGTRPASTIATVVDLEGDDTYDADGASPALAAGFFGIALLADLAGNDTYTGGEASNARALHGVATLADYAGNDTYNNTAVHNQAAAHLGIALLIDNLGDDTFTADAYTQAFAGTLGAAAIVNLQGNDRYLARPGANAGNAYLGRSVSMAQAASTGRRADFTDGHSLAGGYATLVDAAGNDTYTAGAWAQGAAYWWAAAALEDFSGNDIYTADWWAMGAAAHFAAASLTDLRGNDHYNTAPSDQDRTDTPRTHNNAVTRYLAAARDGAIAVATDAQGDDTYLARARSLASADLGCVSIFHERQGNDTYIIDTKGPPDLNPPFAGDHALASVTTYAPWRSFRDDILTAAIFLDAHGTDAYQRQNQPETPPNAAEQPANNTTWDRSESPRERAVGIDRDT